MANLDLKNQAMLRIILCGLLAAGMGGVFFFTHLLPFSFPNRNDQIRSLKAEYQKKSTELARAKASVADLPRFEAEYETLHERWTRAAELLPTDRQFAALLRKITLAGQQTGVQFVLFKPRAIKPDAYYTEMPVEITVNGGYHAVGSFLAELANMRRIVTVTSIKLEVNANGEPTQPAKASLVASAYSLNSGSAPAPAAPAAQAAPAKTEPKGDASHVGKES